MSVEGTDFNLSPSSQTGTISAGTIYVFVSPLTQANKKGATGAFFFVLSSEPKGTD